MSSQRIGSFTISADIVYSDDAPEIFKQLEIIPLRVEMMSYGHVFDYIAISPRFDSVKEGTVPPEYEITVSSMGTSNGRVIAVGVELA